VDLERDKKELLDKRVAVEKQERRTKSLIEENEKLKTYLDENKKAILKEAKLQAQTIIQNANKLVENTIAEIRETKADKEKTGKLRENLKNEFQKNEIKEPTKKVSQESEAILAAGDWVKLTDSETVGRIIDIAKDNVILAIGDLRSVVKRNRVQKVAKKEVPKEIRKSYSSHVTEEMASFSPEIDVRGKRGEEALYEIEKYLDRAIMMGFPTLKIIHGKGDGILRKLIREYLKKYSQVDRMEDEHADRGGDGITYVYLV
jgi:DNA mismatch repair protein MutS2